MSHRVKNLLTIATALTQITSRSKEDMAHELTSRLMASGRAQDLIRPIPGREREARFSVILSRFCLLPMMRREPAFAFAFQCQR